MTLIQEYEKFLQHLKKHGFEEIDFIKFLRNYYFPKKLPEANNRPTEKKEKGSLGRDYTKYSFSGEKNLNKRKTVYKIVEFLLTTKQITVDELNAFSRQHHFTPSTRPLVRSINDVPENLKNRYSLKPNEVIHLGRQSFAVYNQFGGELFDELCEKFNKQYNLKIKRQ